MRLVKEGMFHEMNEQEMQATDGGRSGIVLGPFNIFYTMSQITKILFK